jgi:hypothetical protein
MLQIGGKDLKRHFTVVMGNKEHGLYVSSTPSSAAKKAVTKLCTANKSKKVEFHIREITQGSKKKTYGPYIGYIEKLKEPIELKGRVIQYKPVAKLIGKEGKKMKGGEEKGLEYSFNNLSNESGKISGNILNKKNKFLGQNLNIAKKEQNEEQKKKIELDKKLKEIQQTFKKFKNQENKNKEEAKIMRKIANTAKEEKKKSEEYFKKLQERYPNIRDIKLPNNKFIPNQTSINPLNPGAKEYLNPLNPGAKEFNPKKN